MKNLFLPALVFVFTAITLCVDAQKIDKFSLPNVMTNETVSLDKFPTCEGIVLIFTSNHCPYDEYYRNRIIQLSQAYGARVPVLLVNAHAESDESARDMAAKGRSLGLKIPYLADKDQTLFSQLGVKKSPEAFLLKNVNGTFQVVYRGAIDDNAQVEADVRHHYLRDAIDIMLSNQKIETGEVRAVGCNVKKKG